MISSTAFFAVSFAVVRWIVLAVDAVVLIATPIQGGHHVIDVIAGFFVAALAIRATDAAARFARRPSLPAAATVPAGL